TRAEYASQVDLTVTSSHFGGVFQDPVNFLHLRREQLIDDHFVERLTLTNYLVRDIEYWVEYEFACDFADQFEVRGAKRRERGRRRMPRDSRATGRPRSSARNPTPAGSTRARTPIRNRRPSDGSTSGSPARARITASGRKRARGSRPTRRR